MTSPTPGLELRRPFAANAVKFKCQSNLRNDRGLLVCYVDARLVSERLTLVCGDEWSSDLREFGTAGDVLCSLTVFGVTRQDIGKGGFAKASASDALKRAAVLFGVGAHLYATPTWILGSSESGGHDGNNKPLLKRVKDKKGNTQLYITDDATEWLRAQYSVWLNSVTDRFGEPYDHGDAAESVGDAAAEGFTEPDSPEDLELVKARQDAEAAFAERGNGKVAARTKFEAQLKTAKTVAEVEELVASLEPAE